MTIKKAWLTPWTDDGGLVSLTIESSGVTPESGRILFREQEFPDKSGGGLRHTVNISLLSDQDVCELHALLESHMASRGLVPPFDGGNWERDGGTIKRGDRDSMTVNVAGGSADARSRARLAMQLQILLNGQ